MADYECWPLWWVEIPKNINPHDLPLSRELCKRIENWAIKYDNTLNRRAPQDSGFESGEEREKFVADGLILSNQLQEELGKDYIVTYDTGTI